MNTIYQNGLIFYDNDEILLREYLTKYLMGFIENKFRKLNRSIIFYRFEAPTLIPIELINPNYTDEDYFKTDVELALRPETTKSSFIIANDILDNGAPPICVVQLGKSFRKEQDAPLSKVKLKEFYQLEFQIIFTEDSKLDYHTHAANIAFDAINSKIPGCCLCDSDRLPSYSLKTIDCEHDGLELASISLRTDFDRKFMERKLLVAEIAIGMDRLLYRLTK